MVQAVPEAGSAGLRQLDVRYEEYLRLNFPRCNPQIFRHSDKMSTMPNLDLDARGDRECLKFGCVKFVIAAQTERVLLGRRVRHFSVELSKVALRCGLNWNEAIYAKEIGLDYISDR